MQLLDWLILLAVAGWTLFALCNRRTWHSKCAGCCGNCTKCNRANTHDPVVDKPENITNRPMNTGHE